ncbi:MAG: hypothetical protein DHS20C01_32280 [marine bacterium B5-7]|nr:MAG: hypothetical protein DHS20C01_32280 [marine bacterium B5-7]
MVLSGWVRMSKLSESTKILSDGHMLMRNVRPNAYTHKYSITRISYDIHGLFQLGFGVAQTYREQQIQSEERRHENRIS